MKPKHFILTLLALLTSITASAYTWTDANGTIWSFTVTGSNATLSNGWTTCISGTIPADLTVPSKVYISETAYNVTSIGEYAFQNCTSLISITISDDVTSIANRAFAGCTSLTSVNIPDGVTSIGDYAFNSCSSLTSINIPDGVTSIGYAAFQGCSSLTSINIPEGVTSIGNDAFQWCNSLTSVNIPDGLTSIGNYAFSGCSRLASITLPDGVMSIGERAFEYCLKLTSITVPSSVETIGYGAFGLHYMVVTFNSSTPCYQGGSSEEVKLVVPHAGVAAYREAWSTLANVIVDADHIEKTVDVTANESTSAVAEAIGEDLLRNVLRLKVKGTFNSYDVMVFRNKMINLMDLDLSDANVVASSYAYYQTYKTKDNIITSNFAPTNIVSFKFPKNITALEAGAFYNCQNLKTPSLPDGITSIPNSAFYQCTSFKSISIPESVTSIDDGAFYYCSALTNIHLPERLTTIGSQAFYRCYGFTEMHLPPYLKSIGNNAFSYCENLKTIYAYMPDIISIGTNTFNDYAHQQLYVPEFLYNNYYYDTNWSQFLNVNPTELEPDDYKSLSIQTSDVGVNEDGTAIPAQTNGDAVDVEVGLQGSFTAGEDLSQTAEDAQYFNHADLVLDGEGHGGSLIGEDNGSTAGNLRVNTLRVKINVKAGRWYFFCFPYDVTIANCTYPGQYAWRWYDGVERAANGSGGWKAVAGSTLTAGQGYAFQTSHTGNLIVEFSDPKFGGDRPKTLVAHAAANAANASWNLVGNPYSSFYDFLAADFDAPITVYNSNGTYSAYRPADDECHLQPYEAFFVQKPTEVDAINFEAERRESYNQGQTKKAERTKARRRAGITPERRLINLEMFCGDEQADRTRVVLNEQKSRDYELDCDASKFLSGAATAQLYSIENGVQFAINERPQQGDIRLGYTAAKAGKLSISASRMDMPMVLVDTKENTTFDLSLGSYEFETQAGTFNDRFMLRLSGEATAINNMTKKTGVCIGTQEGGIAIGGAEGKTVNVYTIGGAQAAQHSGNGFVALKRGVYVVSVDGVSAKVSVK